MINWFLFFGYLTVWTVLFFFLVFLNRKQRQLSDDLEELVHDLEQE